jgi:hypothetical protein
MKVHLLQILTMVCKFVLGAFALGAPVSASWLSIRWLAPNKRRRTPAPLEVNLAASLINMAIWIPAYYGIKHLQYVPAEVVRICGCLLIIIAISVGAFYSKMKYLRAYAIGEVLFGVIAAGLTMYSLSNDISIAQVPIFFTSAFLLVRGLENFTKDRDARKAALS